MLRSAISVSGMPTRKPLSRRWRVNAPIRSAVVARVGNRVTTAMAVYPAAPASRCATGPGMVAWSASVFNSATSEA